MDGVNPKGNHTRGERLVLPVGGKTETRFTFLPSNNDNKKLENQMKYMKKWFPDTEQQAVCPKKREHTS